MYLLNLSSLLIEAAVAVVGIMLGLRNKIYGWFIALAYSIYVFYDGTRFFNAAICQKIPAIVFSVASISALIAVILLLRGDQK